MAFISLNINTTSKWIALWNAAVRLTEAVPDDKERPLAFKKNKNK